MNHRTPSDPAFAGHPAVTTFLARYRGETRKSMRARLHRYLGWCEEVGLDPLAATRADIELFSARLTEDGMKDSSIYGYLSGVSMFYRVAVADQRIAHDPTGMVRRPRVQYDDNRLTGLSRHDVEKLILTAHARSPQHAALIVLLGVLALRASEAAAVRIEACGGFDRGHRVLHLVGKGGKPATIPLPPLVARIIDKAAGARTEGPLITTRTGAALSRHDVYRWVRTLGRQAGLGEIHPHQLRHAAATAALDAGASTRDVQAFGRWADPRMVDLYDRNRNNLDRHAAYKLAAHLSAIGATIAA